MQRFSITVAISVAAAACVCPGLSIVHSTERNVSLSRIMIVDDDQTTVDLLKTLLELDGFTVSVVGLGADVIPKAEAAQPELFMVDYNLTDMTGLDVLERLRNHADFSDTPVIIASGMNVEDEVMAAGADRFIVKPFEPSELPELFNRLIAG
jgi:DNA-binding response OmpR family regulator